MHAKPIAAGKSSFDLIDKTQTISTLNITPHSSFLDLACGVGNYSVEIATCIGAKGRVFAVDLWQEGVDLLRMRIDENGIKNIETLVADICTTLPFGENSMDSCLMATVVHDLTVTGQKSSIEEVARLLKPGGLLNIIEFKKIDKGPGPPLAIRMAEEEVEKLVTPYGFKKISCSEVGQFNYLFQCVNSGIQEN